MIGKVVVGVFFDAIVSKRHRGLRDYAIVPAKRIFTNALSVMDPLISLDQERRR